jgi:hypothetical protein
MSIRNQDKPFPLIPEALVEELDRRFPEMSADPGWSDREIWIKSGQRSVVRFLMGQFKRQNENILNQQEEP